MRKKGDGACIGESDVVGHERSVFVSGFRRPREGRYLLLNSLGKGDLHSPMLHIWLYQFGLGMVLSLK